MITHTIVVPWPLSEGFRTWCGRSVMDKALKGHFMATSPDKVDCRHCISAMRKALTTLEEWVPLLAEE